MKKTIILSLKKEIFKEAEGIKKEIEKDPTLDKIEVTEEMDQSLMERIQAYEQEEQGFAKITEEMSRKFMEKEDGKDINAPEEKAGKDPAQFSEEFSGEIGITKEDIVTAKAGKTVAYRRRRLSGRVFAAVAAAAVMVMAFGMTSVGAKLYKLVIREEQTKNGTVKIINESDMDVLQSDPLNEKAALVDIGKSLGITVPELLYKPEGMYWESYMIEEETYAAYVFYMYKGKSFRYWINAAGADFSSGMAEEDTKINEYSVNVEGQVIKIKEFDITGESESRFVAEFTYEGSYYELKGVMEEEEFVKIVENLFF